MYPSTLASWALLIAKGLENCGRDADAIFRQAGLDPEQLRVPGARFDNAALNKLLERTEDACGDPCFGIHISQYWHPTTFHALGYAWLASDTLKNGFQRLIRYADIVSNQLRVEFVLEQNRYRFSFSSDTIPLKLLPLAADIGLSTLVRMCRINFGEDFRPLSISTTRPEPLSLDAYRDYFKCPITFSADINSLYFRKADIEKPLPTSNATLALHSDQLVLKYLAQFQHDDLIFRIKSQLVSKLPTGKISEDEIARAANLSKRTLQRRLRQQGRSISSLLNETKKELAIHYLEHSTLTISEITYLVGFSEPANFSRAFKRWTRTTPNIYRASLPPPLTRPPVSAVSTRPPA